MFPANVYQSLWFPLDTENNLPVRTERRGKGGRGIHEAPKPPVVHRLADLESSLGSPMGMLGSLQITICSLWASVSPPCELCRGPESLPALLSQDRPPPTTPGGEAEGKGWFTMVHEAVVTQTHAKRHRLLPRLAISLEWNKKGRH